DGTNPATLLGYGTWQAFGEGRVPVGVDANDPDFNAPSKVGGEKKHALNAGENGPHVHTGTTSWGGAHNHNYRRLINEFAPDPAFYSGEGEGKYQSAKTSQDGNHRHSFTTNNSGSGTPH